MCVRKNGVRSEITADKNSYGFRPNRCTADAIGQCFVALANKQTARWILEADIKSCFDLIDHDWLMNHIPLDKIIMRHYRRRF